MSAQELLALTYRLLVIVLLVSLPVVLTSVVIGLVIGLLQAVTQVQDQSIAYGAKLVGAFIAIAITASWAGGELLQFGQFVFDRIANLR